MRRNEDEETPAYGLRSMYIEARACCDGQDRMEPETQNARGRRGGGRGQEATTVEGTYLLSGDTASTGVL